MKWRVEFAKLKYFQKVSKYYCQMLPALCTVINKGAAFMKPSIKYQLHGAQILRLDPDGFFYCSPFAFSSVGALRGGQPVIFPQFADRGPYKKHGIAREVAWQTIADERAPYRHRVIMSREFSGRDLAGWPYHASISLDVEYTPGHLLQTFEVDNIGSKMFSWTGGLHPYLAVPDLQKATLSGLLGVPYEDRYHPDQNLAGPEILHWGTAPCEKLFEHAPDLALDTGQCTIKLHTSGFDQWMIWNPGRDGAKALVDLPEEDWEKFVCIEPVCVSRPVILAPGSKFSGQFNIRLTSID